jgi:hypothetical protein
LKQWCTEGGRVPTRPPSPKLRSFDKAEPNSQVRGKYIRNNLIRIRVSIIYQLSGTPDQGAAAPQIPVLSALCPQLNLLNPPRQNSWVRHWFEVRINFGRQRDNVPAHTLDSLKLISLFVSSYISPACPSYESTVKTNGRVWGVGATVLTGGPEVLVEDLPGWPTRSRQILCRMAPDRTALLKLLSHHTDLKETFMRAVCKG